MPHCACVYVCDRGLSEQPDEAIATRLGAFEIQARCAPTAAADISYSDTASALLLRGPHLQVVYKAHKCAEVGKDGDHSLAKYSLPHYAHRPASMSRSALGDAMPASQAGTCRQLGGQIAV